MTSSTSSGAQEADDVLDPVDDRRGDGAGAAGAVGQDAVDLGGIGQQALHLGVDRGRA